MFEIGMMHYILLATILFCIGLLGVVLSRNLLRIFICVELMLNAVNINLVAIANYNDLARLDGHIMTLFVMAVAVCELAVGLAVLFLMFRETQSVNADGECLEGEKWN